MTRAEFNKAVAEWEKSNPKSDQTFPVPGVLLTPICKICKNYRLAPLSVGVCVKLGEIPKRLYGCYEYDCDQFDHNPDAWDNCQFTSDLKPKRTADKVFDDDYE